VWVTDPDGNQWEVFAVKATSSDAPKPSSCCAPRHMKKAVAEAIGTAFLLAAVVGSASWASRSRVGTSRSRWLRTRSRRVSARRLILKFGPISGAHFNPAVTLANAWQGGIAWREVPGYIELRSGRVRRRPMATSYVREAHLLRLAHERSGTAQLAGESSRRRPLAVIWGCSRRAPARRRSHVAAWIVARMVHVVHVVFANPAVTLAAARRPDTFAASPADVPASSGAAPRRRRGDGDLPLAATPRTHDMKTVLSHDHNAGRSQMAAALFDARRSKEGAREFSRHRAQRARASEVVTAMGELGVDLADVSPRMLHRDPRGARCCSSRWDAESMSGRSGLERDDWPSKIRRASR